MRLERIAFLIVGMVACGRATPNEPTTTTTHAARNYAPTTEGQLPEIPPTIRHERQGCTIDLTAPPADGDLRSELSFGPDGPVFARLRGQSALLPRSLTFPIADEASQALVTIRGYSSTVWGWSQPDDVTVFARRPTLVGKSFAPKANVPLRWTGRARPNAIEVTVNLAEVGMAIRGDLPCDAAAWAPGDAFDPMAAVGPFQPGGLWGVLRSDAIAEFAKAASAPSGVPLGPAASSVVVDQRGNELRVALPLAEGLLVGWVTRDAFAPLPTQSREEAKRSATPRCGRGIVDRADGLLQCKGSIPLVAEVGSQKRLVGESVDVQLVAEGPVWTEVQVSPLDPVAGARLLVRTQDLIGCRWVGAERNAPFANRLRDEGERRCF